MPEEPDPHVVSGEILTEGPQRRSRPDVASLDIIEAEYETIAEGRRLFEVPRNESQANSYRFGTLHARSQKNGNWGWASRLLVGGLAAGLFWIAGGYVLMPVSGPVAVKNQTFSAFEIVEVFSRVDRFRRQDVLFVDGKIANNGAESLALPDLVIKVASNDGTVTRYRIKSRGEIVAPGLKYRFSTRLGAPATGVENVRVAIEDRETH